MTSKVQSHRLLEGSVAKLFQIEGHEGDEGRGDKINRGEYDWKIWNTLKLSRF